MENRRFEEKGEPEIVFSKSVKAGKRLYYLDVKKARNEDLYLCITESKKRNMGEGQEPQFEKHKIFLYKEDFHHFLDALNESVEFIQAQVGTINDREEWVPQRAENAASAEPAAEAAEPAAAPEEKKKKLFGFFNR